MRNFTFKSAKKEIGAVLLQSLLAITVVGAMGAGVWAFYDHVSENAKVARETDTLKTFVEKANFVYSGMQNYAGITTEVALRDGVLPEGKRSETGFFSAWKHPIRVEATAVGGVANAGLALVYEGVDQEICSKLVSSGASGFTDVRINGTSVMGATLGSPSNTVDTVSVITQCSAVQYSVVEFIYSSNLALASAIIGTPVAPTVTPGGSPPPTGPVITPPVLPVTMARPAPVVPNAPQPVLGIPVALPGAPVPIPSFVSNPISGGDLTSNLINCVNFNCVVQSPCVRPPRESRTLLCPGGQFGRTSEFRDWSCPDPYGTPVLGAWQVSSSSCQACFSADTQNQNLSCPAGQGGGDITESRTRNFDCAASNTNNTPMWGAFSTWTVTSNTCQVVCTPGVNTWHEDCPSPEVGRVFYRQEFTCSTGLGAPTAGPVVETARTCGSATTPMSSTCSDRGVVNNVSLGSAGSFSGTRDNVTGVETWTSQSGCCVPGMGVGSSLNVVGVMVPGCNEPTSTSCAAEGAGGSGSFFGVRNNEVGTTAWTSQSGCCFIGQPSFSWFTISGVAGVPGCVGSCADSVRTRTQWVDRTLTCPLGAPGSITLQAEQSINESSPTNCSTGIATGAWTAASAWTDTGNTRNTVSTCPGNPCSRGCSALGLLGSGSFFGNEDASGVCVFSNQSGCCVTGHPNTADHIRRGVSGIPGCNVEQACTALGTSGPGSFAGTRDPHTGTTIWTSQSNCCVAGEPSTLTFTRNGVAGVPGCDRGRRVTASCDANSWAGSGQITGLRTFSTGTTVWDGQSGCCVSGQPSTVSSSFGTGSTISGFSTSIGGCNEAVTSTCAAAGASGSGSFSGTLNRATNRTEFTSQSGCCVSGEPSSQMFDVGRVSGVPGCNP